MQSDKEEHDKKKNRRSNANPISALLFCWLLPLFWQGFKTDIVKEDLAEPLKEHTSSVLGDKLERAWNKQVEKCKGTNKKPSLFKAIFNVFGLKLGLYGIVIASSELGARVAQPLLLGRLIGYFTPGSNMSLNEAYMFAAGVVLCTVYTIFVTHPYMMAIMHIGMKIRVAACSLMYRKALRLSKATMGETTVGKIVNLMSNDVNRFDIMFLFVHILWIGPVQTMIVTYFMWDIVNWAALVGLASLFVFIPFQAFLGKKISSYRLKTAVRTDERVRLMNEIISGIQVIKMYTWEKPFANLVSDARKKEIYYIARSSYVRGILISFIIFHSRTSVFCTIISYVLSGEQITAEKVFVLASFYNTLRQTMTVFFPQAITQVSEGMISVKRIREFMLLDEFPSENVIQNDNPVKKTNGDVLDFNKQPKEERYIHMKSNFDKSGVYMKNVSAKWNRDSFVLNNVSLDVVPGKLTVVIGQVGAGKSSLLQSILRELEPIEGLLKVCGRLSYASQDAWLFHGSVRQNILFGEEYNKDKYKKVIKACALKTDFEQLPYGDKTIVGERGVSLSGGQRARINLARAVYKDADVYLLDDPLSAVDPHVSKHLFEECIKGYLKEKVVILVTHQLQYLEKVDQIVLLQNGEIKSSGSYNQLKKSGLDFTSFLPAEESTDQALLDNIDKPSRSRQPSINSVASSILEENVKTPPPEIAETQIKGSVSSRIYYSYLHAGGGWFLMSFTFFMFFFVQFLASGSDYWVAHWVNLEEHSSISEWQRQMCIIVFLILIVSTSFFTLFRSYLFFFMCMRSSMNLHSKMFNTITRATMWFFNTNSSGRVLNRFSKDMGAIDELLTSALIDVLQIFITLLGIIIVVAVVNPWLLIPTALCGIVFYLLRIIYLSTSRSVKRLEGITRSPVFSHVNASLQGLTTIRAFGAQEILIKEFDYHQDLHSSAWYLFIASSRAFGFYLDFVCIIYIAVVTFSFVFIGKSSYGGDVGLAISQAIGLTGMFQWGMRQTAELENQMTSVERVLEYTNLEQEPPLESSPGKKPHPTWPEHGQIEFKDLSLRYSPSEPWVLKNLNFVIKSKEKVGIVGRTGAGKSSLISALFRLFELDGQIVIDGIDTSTIGLRDLRTNISIIPQEPVLFSGTLRENLDPFEEYDDVVLWNAIDEVKLREAVQDLTGGLQCKISEGGSNLSVGQRQLVCLARAIVKNNRILVLDEATANVDPKTDQLIQITIRDKFKNCTVLTIAHRLHTVMDSDKVLVMDAGSMVEFDHPYKLLANRQGFFSKMVEKTGPSTSARLAQIALENFNQHTHL